MSSQHRPNGASVHLLGPRLSPFEVYSTYREIPIDNLPADFVAQMWEKLVPGLDRIPSPEERSLACILGEVQARAVQWPDGTQSLVAWPPEFERPPVVCLQRSYELARWLIDQIKLEHVTPAGNA
jgi:hypothetical protein